MKWNNFLTIQVCQRWPSFEGVGWLHQRHRRCFNRSHKSGHECREIKGEKKIYLLRGRIKTFMDQFFRNLGSICSETGQQEHWPIMTSNSISSRKSKCQRLSGQLLICSTRIVCPASRWGPRPWPTGTRRPAPSTCRQRSSTRTCHHSRMTFPPSDSVSVTVTIVITLWFVTWPSGWGRRGRRPASPPPPPPSLLVTPGTWGKLSKTSSPLR